MRQPDAQTRLGLLIGLLAAVWAYAIATDRPAPAWEMSQLPEVFLSLVALVVLSAAVALPVRAWTRRRRRHDV